VTIELDDKRQAILDAEGHILVLGGPGSGKTTIALLKVKTIFPTLLPGQKLLFLSFSRAAVRQVLTRCRAILTAEERRTIEVKTYHAFCMEFLESHGRLLTGKPVSILYPTEERLTKSKFDGDWMAERQRLAAEDARYCFDLFASGVAELLERSAALRELLASCYPTVVVDEFQDTDDEQWRIVQALAEVTRVFCLADADQRIFEYRDDVNPKRIETLHAIVAPETFDLGGDNHRSPSGGILGFADAVLKNKAPLPEIDDVKAVAYWPNAFAPTVHAAVIWTLSKLRKQGVDNPCVAVLARSNPLIAQLSGMLSEDHVYNGTPLSPVEHGVVWDAELSAAAGAVVASIMEWSGPTSNAPVAATLEAIAHFFDLKNATSPSNSAVENVRKFREAADKVRNAETPRIKAAKEMVAALVKSVIFIGDPVVDWRAARQLLNDITTLRELFREARMVRLFRAGDALGSGLADFWLQQGHYGGAAAFVARTLEHERLISADQDPKGCLLMTMHKSKGKEFDGVVLVEGPFAGPFLDTKRERPPFERSRRLLRVGITRAKTHVTLVRPNGATPLVG
jgi:DNA helicase II / ATP-dependent DNA helicase PcrA